MKQTIEMMVKAIVNTPGHVRVTEETTEKGLVLKLQVAPEDKGRVIGKQGNVATATRTFLAIMSHRAGVKATLEII